MTTAAHGNKAMRLRWQLALVFVPTFLFLVGLIWRLENVHIVTNNGLWKSIAAESWIRDFSSASLEKSNYLYFPLYGFFAYLLDCLGILRATAWKQFAYINAFWASASVVFIYTFFIRLTGDVPTSLLAALFHLGTGFFLLLGVINEDIMPGYTLTLGSMLLAALWFDRPSQLRILGVATLFTLGWLMEWRLLFPAFPAFVLALAVAKAPLAHRVAWIATLVLAIVAVAMLVQQLWSGHNGAVGLGELFWTGKGVETGWGGFTLDKFWLLLNGVSNYFLIFNVSADAGYIRRMADVFSVSVLLQLAILIVCAIMMWPRRHEPRVRCIAVVFLGTCVAGQVLNLYSQPYDPQMQVNVMPWLTVAWGLIVAAVLAHNHKGSARQLVIVGLAVLSLSPLVWNARQLFHWRGGDTESLDTLRAIERNLPPESWVFLYWGFDGIISWQYAMWSHTPNWSNNFDLKTAPSDEPRFKWISVAFRFIDHPTWTSEQQTRALKHSIDSALGFGYRIAMANVWTSTPKELIDQFSFLPRPADAYAVYNMLHDNYEASPVFVGPPAVGTFYELRHKAPR
jgi:hypothetical protein